MDISRNLTTHREAGSPPDEFSLSPRTDRSEGRPSHSLTMGGHPVRRSVISPGSRTSPTSPSTSSRGADLRPREDSPPRYDRSSHERSSSSSSSSATAGSTSSGPLSTTAARVRQAGPEVTPEIAHLRMRLGEMMTRTPIFPPKPDFTGVAVGHYLVFPDRAPAPTWMKGFVPDDLATGEHGPRSRSHEEMSQRWQKPDNMSSMPLGGKPWVDPRMKAPEVETRDVALGRDAQGPVLRPSVLFPGGVQLHAGAFEAEEPVAAAFDPEAVALLHPEMLPDPATFAPETPLPATSNWSAKEEPRMSKPVEIPASPAGGSRDAGVPETRSLASLRQISEEARLDAEIGKFSPWVVQRELRHVLRELGQGAALPLPLPAMGRGGEAGTAPAATTAPAAKPSSSSSSSAPLGESARSMRLEPSAASSRKMVAEGRSGPFLDPSATRDAGSLRARFADEQGRAHGVSGQLEMVQQNHAEQSHLLARCMRTEGVILDKLNETVTAEERTRLTDQLERIRKAIPEMQRDLQNIEANLTELREERSRIDGRIASLQAELDSAGGGGAVPSRAERPAVAKGDPAPVGKAPPAAAAPPTDAPGKQAEGATGASAASTAAVPMRTARERAGSQLPTTEARETPTDSLLRARRRPGVAAADVERTSLQGIAEDHAPSADLDYMSLADKLQGVDERRAELERRLSERREGRDRVRGARDEARIGVFASPSMQAREESLTSMRELTSQLESARQGVNVLSTEKSMLNERSKRLQDLLSVAMADVPEPDYLQTYQGMLATTEESLASMDHNLAELRAEMEARLQQHEDLSNTLRALPAPLPGESPLSEASVQRMVVQLSLESVSRESEALDLEVRRLQVLRDFTEQEYDSLQAEIAALTAPAAGQGLGPVGPPLPLTAPAMVAPADLDVGLVEQTPAPVLATPPPATVPVAPVPVIAPLPAPVGTRSTAPAPAPAATTSTSATGVSASDSDEAALVATKKADLVRLKSELESVTESIVDISKEMGRAARGGSGRLESLRAAKGALVENQTRLQLAVAALEKEVE